MNAKPAKFRPPLWRLEMLRERQQTITRNAHAVYMRAQLELDDLDRQIKERRDEEKR